MSFLSNCCGCEMDGIMTDVEICPECHEHCECECDECGNSGVVFNQISKHWEPCECGQKFDGEKAQEFYGLYDQKVFQ